MSAQSLDQNQRGATADPAGAERSVPHRDARATLDLRRAPDDVPADLPPEGRIVAPVRPGGLSAGVAVIRAALKTMPMGPGVYRMLDRKGEALYVGKARNLKNRVQNYAHPAALSQRLQRMVAETAAMEIVVTDTEAEALLLECNMIKRLMPRFNVLLRDDKSFPLIHLTAGHDFPQITKHRGAQSKPGSYFGPFASAGAVNRTLVTLQKAFLLRSCSDSVFANRTRPCLLYQIKRCSAPCVGQIGREEYAALVEQAHAFLSGKSDAVLKRLVGEMQAAAEACDFEAAAVIRDRIRALSLVQGHQDIHVPGVVDADVIAAYQAGGQTCVQVFFFRGGQNWGNRTYYPSHDRQLPVEEVLTAFVGQFYDDRPKPPLILLSHPLVDQALVAEALSLGGPRVALAVPQRGDKKRLLERILATAREALGRRLAETASTRQLLDGIAAAFGLAGPIDRIEVYDNSHIQGAHAVGAMIVAGPEGLVKSAYRKFTIRGSAPEPLNSPLLPSGGEGRVRGAPAAATNEHHPLTPTLSLKGEREKKSQAEERETSGGDDYAMMREVLRRRFARARKEDADRVWPDLVLIDGGQGQLNVALSVFAEYGITNVAIAAIAKGPDRNAGRERFFLPGRAPFSLDPKDPVLYFLQRLRDEAHRFAIGTHRSRRAKALVRSPLDEIAGIGPRRKQALLHHFGSARAVARAGLGELERVPGVSGAVAKKVHDHFRGDG